MDVLRVGQLMFHSSDNDMEATSRDGVAFLLQSVAIELSLVFC